MLGNVLLGIVGLVIAYLIFNTLMARYSRVGRLAAKVRHAADAETRKCLIKEMAAIGKIRSSNGDAALVYLATLGLGDPNQETREIAHDALKEAAERALIPLICSLDSPGRFRACLLLEELAHPAALPKLQQLATRPNENPDVRHAAMRAIQVIQSGQPLSVDGPA